MNPINKQKFLAELGRLLTFMYEEDRQRALAMYSGMFDETEDENAVMQLLVSPTRQAVILARAYDAKERKLQVHTQPREDGGPAQDAADEAPAFVRAIETIREQAAALSVAVPKVSADQFSLFEEPGDEEDDEEDEEAGSPPDAEPEPSGQDTAGDEDEDGQEPEAAPSDEETAESEDRAAEDVEEFSDAVDAFLSDFTIENNELVRRDAQDAPEAEQEAEPPEAAAPPAGEPEVRAVRVRAAKPAVEEAAPLFTGSTAEPAAAEASPVAELLTEREPRTALLILYILFAVPLVLLGIAILLLPAVLFLALAGAAIFLGVLALGAAFGSFSVFADILLVLGAAIVILALGLLCAWIFVWLLGGAIAGLIRGAFALGRKWCYKEVPIA